MGYRQRHPYLMQIVYIIQAKALGQLTEECGELIQATQKVRRALKGTTPVSLDDALVHLAEECADVALCIDTLATVKLVNEVGVQNIGRYKTGRWYGRVCEDGKQ